MHLNSFAAAPSTAMPPPPRFLLHPLLIPPASKDRDCQQQFPYLAELIPARASACINFARSAASDASEKLVGRSRPCARRLTELFARIPCLEKICLNPTRGLVPIREGKLPNNDEALHSRLMTHSQASLQKKHEATVETAAV